MLPREDTGSYDLTACQIPYDVIDCYSLQGFKHSYVVIDGYPSTKVLVVLCVCDDGLMQYIYCAGKV